MSAQFDGFGTGMAIGGLVGLAAVTKSAIDSNIQHQRSLATIGRWSQALDIQRQRAMKAERALARALVDNQSLAKKLKHAEWELSVLRNA
jgi:hypothetical protein